MRSLPPHGEPPVPLRTMSAMMERQTANQTQLFLRTPNTTREFLLREGIAERRTPQFKARPQRPRLAAGDRSHS